MTESLEFEWVLRPDSSPLLEHYVLHFRGEARAWDDDAGEEILVGRIVGRRVDLALARHDGVSLEELLDSISRDITEFRNTAFSDSNCYVPLNVTSSQPRQHCECLVFIEEVVVDPEHRGMGVGTELFHRMSETIDLEHCVIGLKAFPISNQPGTPRSAEEVDRVKRFYGRLGFLPVGQDYVIKDASQCGAKKKRTATRKLARTPG